MELYSKEIADRLYKEGKMPEWFYRQHYKTPIENYTEQMEKNKEFVLEQIQKKQASNFIESIINDLLKDFEKYQ